MSNENVQTQTDDLAKVSLTTLAPAVELGRQVFSDIAADDLTMQINGETITNAMISDLISAKLNVKLNSVPAIKRA